MTRDNSAKLDGSNAVRQVHISLVAFHLRQARRHAIASASSPTGEELLSEGFLAVVLSALCLEAFSNEMAESVIAEAELALFLKLKGAYRKPPQFQSSVTWKIAKLFETRWAHSLSSDPELVPRIESLFQLRNALVHYQLTDSAARLYLAPPAQVPVDGGGMMTVFDFEQTPTRVEKSLVSRIDAAAAMHSYNTCLAVLKLWNRLANAPAGALASHQELHE